MNNSDRLNDIEGCPYKLDPPVDAKKFCEDGCSVDCGKIMNKKIQASKNKKAKLWLQREAVVVWAKQNDKREVK